MKLEEIPGVLEAVEAHLEQLVANIADPATRPALPRELNLKIKLIPTETRAIDTYEYVIAIKSAPTVCAPAL